MANKDESTKYKVQLKTYMIDKKETTYKEIYVIKHP